MVTLLKWAGIAALNLFMIVAFFMGSVFDVPGLQLIGFILMLLILPVTIKLLERKGE